MRWWAVAFWLLAWQILSMQIGQEILIVSPVQTVDKLGVGCYAQHHFSFKTSFLFIFSKSTKIWLYSSLVFPEFLPVFSDSCMRR